MLAINDLHKRFGEVVALDGCTFKVERGRMLGFLGPNGAGKAGSSSLGARWPGGTTWRTGWTAG